MSFTVLHQRALRSKCIAMSSTMDLIASLDFEGSLTVLRTFLWLICAGDGEPSCVEFSPCGFVIAVGCDNGQIALVDAESQKIVQCRNGSSGCNIIRMRWLMVQDGSATGTSPRNLVSLAGIPPIASEDDTPASNQPDILSRLQSTMLLAQADDGTLLGYASGQYLLFIVRNNSPTLLLPRYFGLNHSSACYLDVTNSATCQQLTIPNRIAKLSVYTIAQRFAHLLIDIRQDLASAESALKSSAKKWKDALRTVGPKLSLAHSTLVSYELDFTVSQFFYTIAMCQHWHPAAQTIFGSQWNEQNLTRLRQGIDAASYDIVIALQSHVLTALTNALLRSRECYEVLSRYGDVQWGITTQEWMRFIDHQQQLCYKLDEAIAEAKRARLNMLQFMQFIRVNMALAKDAATPTPAGIDTTPSASYLSLFEPLSQRAPELQPLQSNPSIPLSKLQAESVTGTHLYAYLEETTMPEQVIRSKDEVTAGVRQLSELVCGKADTSCSSLSLLSHIKHVQRLFDGLYPNLCSACDASQCSALTASTCALRDAIMVSDISLRVANGAVSVSGLVTLSTHGNAITIIVRSSLHSYIAKLAVHGDELECVEFYCHFPANASQRRFALVGVTSQRQLIKIDLADVLYTILPPDNDETGVFSQNAEVQSRSLSMRSVGGLYVSGSRGVVCALDGTNSQIVVMDMEENEEESENEEEADDDDEEDE